MLIGRSKPEYGTMRRGPSGLVAVDVLADVQSQALTTEDIDFRQDAGGEQLVALTFTPPSG